MMGKTHVAMGIAVSLAVMHPINPHDCIIAVACGALGGVAADIDTVKNDYKHDALFGQLIAVGLIVIGLVMDMILKYGICSSIINDNKIKAVIGIIIYLIIIIIGFFSEHRTFSHSLLTLALLTAAIWLIYPAAALPYAIGYATHLLLDLLNKKDVPLLFPKKKGICLKLCYASGVANTVFMWVGLAVSIVLIVNAVVIRFY